MSRALHTPSPPQSAALRSFASQWRMRPADSLSPLREQALQRFLALGLPTLSDETWRYTNLRSLAAQSFVDAPRNSARRLGARRSAFAARREQTEPRVFWSMAMRRRRCLISR